MPATSQTTVPAPAHHPPPSRDGSPSPPDPFGHLGSFIKSLQQKSKHDSDTIVTLKDKLDKLKQGQSALQAEVDAIKAEQVALGKVVSSSVLQAGIQNGKLLSVYLQSNKVGFKSSAADEVTLTAVLDKLNAIQSHLQTQPRRTGTSSPQPTFEKIHMGEMNDDEPKSVDGNETAPPLDIDLTPASPHRNGEPSPGSDQDMPALERAPVQLAPQSGLKLTTVCSGTEVPTETLIARAALGASAPARASSSGAGSPRASAPSSRDAAAKAERDRARALLQEHKAHKKIREGARQQARIHKRASQLKTDGERADSSEL